ncbi:MAG: helix-turn-helix domain-containing protein [Firmicutes bacterium]|nr:helix-turn-helix domain-containing protein [Bacillota bacterium]
MDTFRKQMIEQTREALTVARAEHRRWQQRLDTEKTKETLRALRIAKGTVRSLEWELSYLEKGGERPCGQTLVDNEFWGRACGTLSTEPYQALFGGREEVAAAAYSEAELEMARHEVRLRLTYNERVVYEAYQEGMTTREIARVLGVSTASARDYLRRAEQKLSEAESLQVPLPFST